MRAKPVTATTAQSATMIKKIIPSVPEVGREALIVLGGALLAALIVGQIPGLRDWIKSQWLDTPRNV